MRISKKDVPHLKNKTRIYLIENSVSIIEYFDELIESFSNIIEYFNNIIEISPQLIKKPLPTIRSSFTKTPS